MAESTGLGKSLYIPEDFLKDLTKADNRIKKLSTQMEKFTEVTVSGFGKMSASVDPFLEKLERIATLAGTSSTEMLKGSKEQIAALAKMSGALDGLKKTGAEDPLEKVNAGIAAMKRIIDESTPAIEKYKRELAAIGSGSGSISMNTIKEGKAGQSITADAYAELKRLEAEKSSIIATTKEWDNYINRITTTTFAQQRQADAMESLNNKLREEARLADKTDKENKRKEKADARAKASREIAAASQAERRAYSEGQKDLTAYNRAMEASEATMTQRINKLAKLAAAEKRLSESSKDYSTKLTEIRAQMERVNSLPLDDKIQKAAKNSSNLMDISGQLARKLALVFSVSQIQGYVERLMTVRGEFELQQRSLQAILQNREEADALFEKVTALAVESPYRVKELVTYTKQLAAYRIETSKLYDTTKMLADVSSGLGVDMNRMILAFGQVKAANYLRGQELRQFSEAGVNILGELATYFSELEGRMVSVGEVFEMVSKRMVSFGDVEKIFKKLTSAGGIFYNMQEIQAQTLQGMISNLKDSIDLMFNDIGKANDSVLKGFVNILKSIVENWRVFANILSAAGVGMALYTTKVVYAGVATKAFTGDQIAATVATKGLTASLAKVMIGLQNIGKFMKSNVWVLGLTAVATAGFFIYDHVKQVEAVTAAYDTLGIRLEKQISTLSSFSSEISANNRSIESARSAMDGAKKGSEEYEAATDKLNKANSEQSKILVRLKRDFPEVYAGLVKQKNGTIDLTEAQTKYNAQLRETISLNYHMAQRAGFFSKDFSTSIGDLSEKFDGLKKSMSDANRVYEITIGEVNRMSALNPDFDKKYGASIRNIMQSNMTYYEKIVAIREKVRGAEGRIAETIFKPSNDLVREIRINTNRTVKELGKTQEAVDGFVQDILKSYSVTSVAGFRALPEEVRKQANAAISEVLRSLPAMENKFVKDRITSKLSSTLGLTINVDKKEIQKDLSNVQANINSQIEAINKSQKIKLNLITYDETPEEFFKGMLTQIKELKEESARASKATQPLYDEISNADKVKKINAQAAAMQKLANAYGFFEKGASGSADSRLRNQLSLLKEISSSYQKLLSTSSATDATANIRKSFGSAYSNLGLGDISSLDPSLKGISARLEKMLTSATKKTRASLEKEVGSFKSEIDISIRKESIDNMKRELDSLMSSFSLSEDLKKAKITPDLAKSFGFEMFDMDTLKKKISERQAAIGEMSEDEAKIFKDLSDKVAEHEKSALLEQLKQFSSYLKTSLSEIDEELSNREYMINIATNFMDQGKINAEQFSAIISRITSESNEKISKIQVEKFKQSGDYIKAMGDLSIYTSRELENMTQKIQELIRANAGSMRPSDLKEYTRVIGELQARIKTIRNPFEAGWLPRLKDVTKAQKDYNQALKEEAGIRSTIKKQRDKLKSLEEKAAEIQAALKENPGDEALLDRFDLIKTQIVDTNEELGKSEDNLNAIQSKMSVISKAFSDAGGGLQGTLAALGAGVADVSGYLKDVSELYTDIKDLFGSMGVDTDSGVWNEINQVIEIVDGFSSKIGEATEKLKSGNVFGAVTSTIGAFTGIFTNIFKQHDKRRQKTIDAELKKIALLEKAYSRIEDRLSSSISLSESSANQRDALANIKEQENAINRAIAAEKDKKKTNYDQIREWEDQLLDLADQRMKAQQETIMLAGGIGKDNWGSEAESFADAWYQAFKETGNGVDGLNEKWDEFIDNMMVKQLSARLFDARFRSLFNEVDKMFTEDSDGGAAVTKKELESIGERYKNALKGFDEDARKILEELGIKGGTGASELSGLSQSLQVASEETMSAISGYLNSIRNFVSGNATTLNNLFAAITSADLGKNVLLAEMKEQTRLLSVISSNLASVISPNYQRGGGYCIKTDL